MLFMSFNFIILHIYSNSDTTGKKITFLDINTMNDKNVSQSAVKCTF